MTRPKKREIHSINAYPSCKASNQGTPLEHFRPTRPSQGESIYLGETTGGEELRTRERMEMPEFGRGLVAPTRRRRNVHQHVVRRAQNLHLPLEILASPRDEGPTSPQRERERERDVGRGSAVQSLLPSIFGYFTLLFLFP